MYSGHNQDCVGDFSFMEELLPENYKLHHHDSYPGRFQGSISYKGKLPSNDMPIAILKLARNYQTFICPCCKGFGHNKDQHIVWTIWFDDPVSFSNQQ